MVVTARNCTQRSGFVTAWCCLWQRGRQSAPCSDAQGADHQHRSHSFDASVDDATAANRTRGIAGSRVKVVSIGGAKGKKIIEAQLWKSQPYRQARAQRSAIESLVFTLKDSFEFGEMRGAPMTTCLPRC